MRYDKENICGGFEMQKATFYIMLQHYLTNKNKSITTEAEHKQAIETLKNFVLRKTSHFL